MEDFVIELELKVGTVNAILNVSAKAPYGEVVDLISEIHTKGEAALIKLREEHPELFVQSEDVQEEATAE
jgi:hypothetical protein